MSLTLSISRMRLIQRFSQGGLARVHFIINSHLYQKNVYIDLIVNSNVLFSNLLEIFFSIKWIGFYSVRKALIQKIIFSKINFFNNFFISFKMISCSFFICKPSPKNLSMIFIKFLYKYPKSGFWIPVIRQIYQSPLGMSKKSSYWLKMIV